MKEFGEGKKGKTLAGISLEEISKKLIEIKGKTLEEISKEFIEIGNVHIFGEFHDRPRVFELIVALQSGQYTHLILELSEDMQQTLDEFAQDKIVEISQLEKLSIDYQKLVEEAKKNKVRVIAGDMSGAKMREWILFKHKHMVDYLKNYLKQFNLGEKQIAEIIATIMIPERSRVTVEKINNILSENPNAKILVSCGALHVEYIVEGLEKLKEKGLS